VTFVTPGLCSLWLENKARFPRVDTLVFLQDNGPENSGRRSQFLYRMVQFVEKHQVNVRLAYYPPYHSKYNPVERCWGVLETHWNGALLDMSGGLAQPNDATPANLMRLEWVRNYDGTWRIIEECQKGDVHTVVHGDVVEEQYGQSITAITGSELQPVLSDPEQYTSNPLGADGTSDPALYTQNTDLFDPNSPDYLGAGNVETKLNPTILEKTWAQSISSYTGSSACRIPTIHEETWAQAITEVTNCSGTIHSTTIAGVVEEVTEVGSINEVTTVGSAIGITVAASMAEVTVAGIQLEAALIPLHASIEVG